MSSLKEPVIESTPAYMKENNERFSNAINENRGAVFFAVCRGKVSEGIDFSDRRGRGVIVTGLPYPPVYDKKVTLKKKFLDDKPVHQRGLKKLSGNEWYCQQASRSVNQAIGRVIRHMNDYGVILLCDERFSREEELSRISKWLRPYCNVNKTFGESIKTVSSFFTNVMRNPSFVLAPEKPLVTISAPRPTKARPPRVAIEIEEEVDAFDEIFQEMVTASNESIPSTIKHNVSRVKEGFSLMEALDTNATCKPTKVEPVLPSRNHPRPNNAIPSLPPPPIPQVKPAAVKEKTNFIFQRKVVSTGVSASLVSTVGGAGEPPVATEPAKNTQSSDEVVPEKKEDGGSKKENKNALSVLFQDEVRSISSPDEVKSWLNMLKGWAEVKRNNGTGDEKLLPATFSFFKKKGRFDLLERFLNFVPRCSREKYKASLDSLKMKENKPVKTSSSLPSLPSQVQLSAPLSSTPTPPLSAAAPSPSSSTTHRIAPPPSSSEEKEPPSSSSSVMSDQSKPNVKKIVASDQFRQYILLLKNSLTNEEFARWKTLSKNVQATGDFIPYLDFIVDLFGSKGNAEVLLTKVKSQIPEQHHAAFTQKCKQWHQKRKRIQEMEKIEKRPRTS